MLDDTIQILNKLKRSFRARSERLLSANRKRVEKGKRPDFYMLARANSWSLACQKLEEEILALKKQNR